MGKMFVCPVASSLSKLKDVVEFEGDFLDFNESLDSENSVIAKRRQILDFYKQDFFKACDYCHDMSAKKTHIQAAIQMDGILQMKP